MLVKIFIQSEKREHTKKIYSCDLWERESTGNIVKNMLLSRNIKNSSWLSSYSLRVYNPFKFFNWFVLGVVLYCKGNNNWVELFEAESRPTIEVHCREREK